MGVVEFDSVSKTYRDKAVLDHFSLVVYAGERVVILGPSGCGMTTVLRLLAGFIAPDSGSISINGQVVTAAGIVIQPPERRGPGMVFQDMALWPHMTVEGNLMFGLKVQRVSKLERMHRTEEMFALVQTATYQNVRPSELSGGSCRLVLHADTGVSKFDGWVATAATTRVPNQSLPAEPMQRFLGPLARSDRPLPGAPAGSAA
jgi:iron(III) transport system ATP-binding protein